MFRTSGKSPIPSHESFTFPKHSPLLPYFNHYFKILNERGVLFHLRKKWNLHLEKTNCDTGGDVKKISIYRVFKLFSILGCGILIAIILLLFENLVNKYSAMPKENTHII